MRLKALEIHGFKTFPDRTKLNFNHGFTAVVGPNGSGKSNISDAIRWVLGEQSTKNLRCSKMEDIVFSGTTGRRAHGYAEVTMTIENHNRTLPFDSDSVAVTRRYYRSGESEYLINNATVRLKDIHELFMDTGLGRDGYSVIGQGKIDSIVSARSEDRREIFEEAAGVSRYRYRKEEAERKLLHAQENLLRLQDIAAELEGRVEPLRVQAEAARQYLELYEEKRRLEIGLWLHTLENSGNNLRVQEEKIAVVRNQETQVQAQLQAIETEIEQSFARTNACTVQMDQIRTQTAQAEENAVRKEGEISVLQNDMRHNEQSIARIQGELQTAALSHKTAEQQLAQQQERLAAAQQRVEQNHLQQQELQQQLAGMRTSTEQSHSQIVQTEQELQQLTEQTAQMQLQEKVAASAMEREAEKQDAYTKQVQSYQQQLHTLHEAQADYARMFDELQQTLAQMTQTIAQQEQALTACRANETQAKQTADRLLLDLNEQERRLKFLENLESNLEGFHHAVKAVMSRAESGGLTGVHGPVSRLIEVPKQYAVAIETALGAAMQHIVVGNEQDAKQAILFLKQKDKGRATFLPLSTIKANRLQENGVTACAGFVGIADDLCQCKAEYRAVLHALLGRIVIAETLDAATAIARKFQYRFRIVTLDGQVINAGGSMTGGSQVRSAGLLSRSAEITQSKAQIAALQTQCGQAQQAHRAAEQTTQHAAQELEQAKNTLYARREEAAQLQAELGRVQAQCGDIQALLNGLQAEQVQSGAQIAQQRQAQQDAAEKLRQAAGNITALQSTLAQLSGNREESDRKSRQLAEQLQELRLEGVTAEKEQEALQKELDDLRRDQNDYDRRTETLQREIRAMTGANELVTRQIAALQQEVQTLRDQASNAKVQIEQLSEQRLQAEQQCAQLRVREREVTADRENLGRELARLEERKGNLQKEYDSIVTRLWEEYELTRREAQALEIEIAEPEKGRRRLSELKAKIKALGTVNVAAIDEYKEVSERYQFLTAQIADVEQSRAELRKLIYDLTHQMKDLFLERFAQINTYFKETFQTLFGGGKASLELQDPDNVLQSGIGILVHPPGKIVTNIELLSGGEKALVAIALYFAIMKVSPPPFCILDEIEAALDDVNVTRFASYLRKMNENTQFVTITHRRGTMEEADVLYGVTMQEQGVSKLLELDVTEIEEKLGL